MNLDIIENKVFESKFDYKKIKSGDIILANRLDGLDQLIMWGTGSHIGHTAIATWINDELYILESTDRLSFGVPCWDPPYGIIKNKWDKWFRNIKKCNTSISIIRLNDKFNLNFTKSNLFFDKVKGLPYGYNNFIYGWIDTINNNYPDNFNSNLLYVILNFLENKLDLSVYKIFSQGLNKRLNTNYKKIKEIMVHMLNRNIRFNELLTVPESDKWNYTNNNKTGKSFVCDVFVLNYLREAGLFNNLSLELSEFTPKDLYQLKIFNNSWTKNHNCLDNKEYICQIYGRFNIELNNFNSIEPYNKMNENCSSKAPEYIRENKC